MTITAETVKTLRERTGAGMMECKKALVETGGDLDAAAEIMRKAGLAKADKKAGRVAAEGTIATALSGDGRSAVLVEVNSETDFVARQPEFQAFAADVARAALASPASTGALAGLVLASGASVDDTRRGLVAKIGEKIDVRRAAVLNAPERIGSYVHGTRIGAIVALRGGDEALARDLAMHVAAADPSPVAVERGELQQSLLDSERAIYRAQAEQEGKPAKVIDRIVDGKLNKFAADVCLVEQAFVKDPERSIGDVLGDASKQAGAPIRVVAFRRFKLGEAAGA